MEAGKMINQIANRLRRRSMAVQESIGVSESQGKILNYILVESLKRSVYQKDIEKEFGLRPPTASEALKILEKKKLICRVPDKTDGRLKKLVFTREAEKIQDALKKEIEETEETLLAGVSEDELAFFMKITGRMLANLDAD